MELIVGKWYTDSGWNEHSYLKFSHKIGTQIYGSDMFVETQRYHYSWTEINGIRECTKEEMDYLKSILPDYKFDDDSVIPIIEEDYSYFSQILKELQL